MTNTEWILVGQAKKGDAHSFALLYQKYYNDLYRFALCLLKGSHQAEDAVSSAVLKAYENLPALRKNDSFKSWLFQITANECKKVLNKSVTYLSDAEWNEPAAVEEGFLSLEVQELLALLKDEERLVVTLSVFGGYNSKEIAKILHKKEGTVRSLKSRSMGRLREEISRIQKGE